VALSVVAGLAACSNDPLAEEYRSGDNKGYVAGKFKVVEITEEESDTVDVDHVIRTDPAAGVDVKEGDSFTLVVSKGPPPVPLPETNGQTVEDATALLTAAGLTASVQPGQYDETVPAGVVLSAMVPQQPMLEPGAMVEKGTEVQLVPSLGPEPRVMPDMINVTLERSTARLTELRLGWEIIEQFVTDAVADPPGEVIAQSIEPRTEVPRDTVVVLTVSKGLDLVVFPDLTGLDYNGVVATLTNAGFIAGTPPAITAGDTSKPLWQVLIDGADAVVGQAYLRNSVVNLVYQEPDPPPADTTPPA